jgi:chorismate mutase
MTSDPSLVTVRQEIDAIDDAIHDLIIRRTELVEQVRRIKEGWSVKIQPSREAEIIYRLLARHRGPFPKRELIAMWRQMITATLSFEGPFSIAVCVLDDDAGLWDVARDHFGMFVPISRHGTVRSVIEAVHRQEATCGVLPLPRQDDADPWWRHLITSRPAAPKVIARLPFAGPSNARTGTLEALVICPVVVTATGRDRVLIGGESERDLAASRFIQALKQCGLSPVFSAAWQEVERPHPCLFYTELDGYLGPDDPRLDEVRTLLGKSLNRLLWLGGYAQPLTADVLGPGWTQPASARQRGDGVPAA